MSGRNDNDNNEKSHKPDEETKDIELNEEFRQDSKDLIEPPEDWDRE